MLATIIAITVHATAIIATGFQFNSDNFLTAGLNFVVTRAKKTNLIPCPISVTRKSTTILTSNTPAEIENIPYGRGRKAAKSNIQKSHFANIIWISL